VAGPCLRVWLKGGVGWEALQAQGRCTCWKVSGLFWSAGVCYALPCWLMGVYLRRLFLCVSFVCFAVLCAWRYSVCAGWHCITWPVLRFVCSHAHSASGAATPHSVAEGLGRCVRGVGCVFPYTPGLCWGASRTAQTCVCDRWVLNTCRLLTGQQVAHSCGCVWACCA
jgi:hypothetical protein